MFEKNYQDEIRSFLEEEKIDSLASGDQLRAFTTYKGTYGPRAQDIIKDLSQRYQLFSALDKDKVTELYNYICTLRDELSANSIPGLKSEKNNDDYINALKSAYVFKIQSKIAENAHFSKDDIQGQLALMKTCQKFGELNDLIRRGVNLEDIQKKFTSTETLIDQKASTSTKKVNVAPANKPSESFIDLFRQKFSNLFHSSPEEDNYTISDPSAFKHVAGTSQPTQASKENIPETSNVSDRAIAKKSVRIRNPDKLIQYMDLVEKQMEFTLFYLNDIASEKTSENLVQIQDISKIIILSHHLFNPTDSENLKPKIDEFVSHVINFLRKVEDKSSDRSIKTLASEQFKNFVGIVSALHSSEDLDKKFTP